MGSPASARPEGLRERVRFYLLDHRTPTGKAIDVALLALNLVFVGVFVAQTYPTSAAVESWLWASDEKVSVTRPQCGLSSHDPDASHCKACGHVIYQEYAPEE